MGSRQGSAIASGHGRDDLIKPTGVALLLVTLGLALGALPAAWAQSDAANADASQVLLDAAERGDARSAVNALNLGADVNVRNPNGFSPLMFAALLGHRGVAALLVSAGADVNARFETGATPLMAAAIRGELEIVRVLVDAGADPSLRNSAGATAGVKAEEYGKDEVALYLRQLEQSDEETGNIEPAPASVSAASDAPGAARFSVMIQLGSLRSLEEAQRDWTRLRSRFPELLEGRELEVEEADLGSRGIFFRVQTGPFPNRAGALELCRRFKARNQNCLARFRYR